MSLECSYARDTLFIYLFINTLSAKYRTFLTRGHSSSVIMSDVQIVAFD